MIINTIDKASYKTIKFDIDHWYTCHMIYYMSIIICTFEKMCVWSSLPVIYAHIDFAFAQG